MYKMEKEIINSKENKNWYKETIIACHKAGIQIIFVFIVTVIIFD